MFYILSGILILISYFLGSVSTAVWISRGIYGDDIRNHGSGNAGSTNMFRVFGVKAGILTQLVDIAKGSVAALIPVIVFYSTEQSHLLSEFPLSLQATICGFLAAIGHIYPVFSGFRGGKGINTLLGTILVASPLAAAFCLAVFILVVLTTRFVSLGSMLGTLTFSLYLTFRKFVLEEDILWISIGFAFAMFLLVVFTHRSNIGRLLQGNENKANIFRKKKQN